MLLSVLVEFLCRGTGSTSRRSNQSVAHQHHLESMCLCYFENTLEKLDFAEARAVIARARCFRQKWGRMMCELCLKRQESCKKGRTKK